MVQSEKFKSADTSALTSQLLYAFNPEDETAGPQVLNQFKKQHPDLEFVGAFTDEGQFIGPDDVMALANLPSKEQLRGQLIGLFSAPLSGFVSVLGGNVRGVLNVLNARAETIK
jgi:large subunit ribosomal protein L10